MSQPPAMRAPMSSPRPQRRGQHAPELAVLALGKHVAHDGLDDEQQEHHRHAGQDHGEDIGPGERVWLRRPGSFPPSGRSSRGSKVFRGGNDFLLGLAQFRRQAFPGEGFERAVEHRPDARASRLKAWTAPDSITAMVFMNSSTMSGRNCSAGFFTTLKRHRLGSSRSRVKRSGMMTMAEALPLSCASGPRPRRSPSPGTSSSFGRSKAPRRSREARPLSWSTRSTGMGGSWLASGRGAENDADDSGHRSGMA